MGLEKLNLDIKWILQIWNFHFKSKNYERPFYTWFFHFKCYGSSMYGDKNL
jgi:hypothetical protein